jgi:ankyrin repeat protein
MPRRTAATWLDALLAARPEAAALDARDAHGRTPLHVATFARQREAVQAGCCKRRRRPAALENDRYDAVTIAAVADDEETLRVLLAGGASARLTTSRYDGTALIAAAHLGHDGVVRQLIAGRRAAGPREQPALDGGDRGHRAGRRRPAAPGHACRRCCRPAPAPRWPTAAAAARWPWPKAGATRQWPRCCKRTARAEDSAFLLAGARGRTKIVRLALAAGADLKSTNRYGGTALIPACHYGHVETVRLLLGTKIAVDHVNKLGWTALLEAVILGDGGPRHTEIVRLLLAHGATRRA